MPKSTRDKRVPCDLVCCRQLATAPAVAFAAGGVYRNTGVWYAKYRRRLAAIACGTRAWCAGARSSAMTGLSLKIEPIAESFSLKARIYASLKHAIMDMNIYAEDAQLRLDERELSQQFGISRTPLREALAQLDQEGLVRIVPRRGIYIVRKTKDEILDMITVWAALESMSARLATKEATDEELSCLHTLVDQFSQDELAR